MLRFICPHSVCLHQARFLIPHLKIVFKPIRSFEIEGRYPWNCVVFCRFFDFRKRCVVLIIHVLYETSPCFHMKWFSNSSFVLLLLYAIFLIFIVCCIKCEIGLSHSHLYFFTHHYSVWQLIFAVSVFFLNIRILFDFIEIYNLNFFDYVLLSHYKSPLYTHLLLLIFGIVYYKVLDGQYF